MSITWNNCNIIYENGEFHKDCVPKTEMFQAFLNYCSAISHSPKLSVWYDVEDKVCFGQEQTWLNTISKDSFFVSDESNFLVGEGNPCNANVENNYRPWDRRFVLDYYGDIFGKNIVENNEVIYFDLPQLEKIKGAKVLLVGAGPSTNSYDWDPNDYDCVLSCNNFFLNDRLKHIDVVMATIGTEVDLFEDNVELHDYMDKNSTIICFEDRLENCHKKGLEYIKNKYPNRVMYSHSRYRGKIGSVPRLLCLVTLLGAKEIDVVGMDGFAKGANLNDHTEHAFEKRKLESAPVRQGTYDYGLYRRHYVMLWDYLLNNIGKDVKFRNLGEDHKSNMSSDISKQMFPLKHSQNKGK